MGLMFEKKSKYVWTGPVNARAKYKGSVSQLWANKVCTGIKIKIK
jgi:hypothetical protein